jgi:hypothetical protein
MTSMRIAAVLTLALGACGDSTDGGRGARDAETAVDAGPGEGQTTEDGAVAPGNDGGAPNGEDASTLPLPTNDAGAEYFWSGQEAYIKASNTKTCGIHTYCNFGATVAISADGNTLAVGSPQESSPSTGVNQAQDGTKNDLFVYSGAVYLFTRSNGQWSQQAYIKASNTHAHDNFGTSVSLSADGNTLVVGAPGEDSTGAGVNGSQDQTSTTATESGAVYVFERSGGTVWSQSGYIKAEHPSSGSVFGSALRLSGDGSTLLVGAPGEASSATGVNGDQTDVAAGGSGAAFVYVRSTGSWTYQAYLKASNTGYGDRFGASLAISKTGDVVAVGAPNEAGGSSEINGNADDDSMMRAGAAYTFMRSGTTWTPGAYLKSPTSLLYTYFGWAVALSENGSTLAVSQPDNTNAARAPNGRVHFFKLSNGNWARDGLVSAPNPASHNFGWSVALSADGNRLIVGDSQDDSGEKGLDGEGKDTSAPGAGAVDAFARKGSAWSWVEYAKASNAYAGTLFGTSVAASADALTVAVGAKWELSSAEGIDGPQSNSSSAYGAVYVFD